MQPRLRSASSAARTKRSATSPVKTGILLIANAHLQDYKGGFVRLVDGVGEAEKIEMFKEATAGK